MFYALKVNKKRWKRVFAVRASAITSLVYTCVEKKRKNVASKNLKCVLLSFHMYHFSSNPIQYKKYLHRPLYKCKVNKVRVRN